MDEEPQHDVLNWLSTQTTSFFTAAITAFTEQCEKHVGMGSNM
jgi:hypothetical protein